MSKQTRANDRSSTSEADAGRIDAALAGGDAGGEDVGQAEVQAIYDEAAGKGYVGEVPDPTPNANYTLGGQTAGAPTPEAARPAADAVEARIGQPVVVTAGDAPKEG